MLWILAGVAVLVANLLVSGWWVPVLAVAIWIGLVLLAALIGSLLPKATETVTEPEPFPASVPLKAPALGLVHATSEQMTTHMRATHPDAQGQAWYGLLDEIGICFNERWPRTDICSAREFFLRKGDRLLLRYIPPPGESPGHRWPCDFAGRWRGGELARQLVQVGTEQPQRFVIDHDGLYEVGIGQGSDPRGGEGAIAVWLETDSLDRLSLSSDPQQESHVAWTELAEGEWRVQIDREAYALDRATMPQRVVGAVPAEATLLFDAQTQAWDEASIADPHSDWDHDLRHLYRYYFQLSRGDVLAVEYAWEASRFGLDLEHPGGTTCTDGHLELSQFVRSPTLLSEHSGWLDGEAGPRRIKLVTCPADGLYQIDLELRGPPEWRGRASGEFVQVRVWGALLRRPGEVRDFALVQGWVHQWYRRTIPVPRAVSEMWPRT